MSIDERYKHHRVVIDRAGINELNIIRRSLEMYKDSLAKDIVEFSKSDKFVDSRIESYAKTITNIQSLLNEIKVVGADKVKIEDSCMFQRIYY